MEVKYNIIVLDNDFITVNGIDFQSKYHITNNNVGREIGNAIQEYNKRIRTIDGAYNKAVYWPEYVQVKIREAMTKRYVIKPSSHFYDKCELLSLPYGCYKTALYGEVIEVEIVNNQVVKIITRLQDRKYLHNDNCFAIIFKEYNTALVKTVWQNNHYDNHHTIDKSKYVQK